MMSLRVLEAEHRAGALCALDVGHKIWLINSLMIRERNIQRGASQGPEPWVLRYAVYADFQPTNQSVSTLF